MESAEDEVASQGSLDGDLGRLVVADLADHDDVRVLADDGAQAVGEGQPDLGPDLDLADALDLVLDRVLNGQDISGRRPDLLKRGIKRGGFARAGRPGRQDDAVRDADHPSEPLQSVRAHPQLFQAEHRCPFVQDTHDSPLAVDGGNDGDAHVHTAPGDDDADAAVLGQAALGDIHLAENFEARDQGGVHPLGRTHDVAQHPVHPVADLDLALVRLHMDVAGPVSDGLGEDQVDHLDDGSLARHLLQVGQIGRLVYVGGQPAFLVLTRQTGQNPFEEDLLDLLPDQAGGGEHGARRHMQQHTQIVGGGQRLGRPDGDDKHVALDFKWQHLLFEREVTGREPEGGLARLDVFQINPLEPVFHNDSGWCVRLAYKGLAGNGSDHNECGVEARSPRRKPGKEDAFGPITEAAQESVRFCQKTFSRGSRT